MQTFLRYLFLALFGLFCFAYPFAVIGVAFDVKPPFSLDWAGSALLFLEGTLLIVSAMLLYNRWQALLAGLCVILLSYGVETLGVTTGFPFGSYYYTGILFPSLPGGVPLAVMFAWVLVVFGSYGVVMKGKKVAYVGDTLLAAAPCSPGTTASASMLIPAAPCGTAASGGGKRSASPALTSSAVSWNQRTTASSDSPAVAVPSSARSCATVVSDVALSPS